MSTYFFKKETFRSYQVDVISDIVRSLVTKTELHPKNFTVTHSEKDEYPTYEISIHGVHQYTLIHRPFYFRLQREGAGCDDIGFDSVFTTTDILGIKCVTAHCDINDKVDSLITGMVNKALLGYVKHIASDIDKERGKISIDYNNRGVDFEYGLTVDSTLVDSRFPVMYKKECESHEEVYIEPDTSLENVRDIIDSVVSRVRNKINAAQSRYDNIKETIGGVTINVDGKNILCHKSFKPLITGGFITFKCPYTNSMVSLKSTKYDCVTVIGMDEVYGFNDSIVLIGNN
jgi:hypothetical protein